VVVGFIFFGDVVCRVCVWVVGGCWFGCCLIVVVVDCGVLFC